MTATTLSLVVIFLPVAFMGGLVGKFWNSFGLTATFAIMVSLVIAFTLTPMLAARILSHSAVGPHGEIVADLVASPVASTTGSRRATRARSAGASATA